MRNGKICLLAMMLAAMTGCGERPAYSHFEPVDCEGWNRADTLHFSAPVDERHTCTTVRLDLRSTTSYPYTQISLVVRQRAKASGCRRTDTVNIDITDRQGNMQGKGSTVRTFSAVMPAAPMKAVDTLDVTVTHVMNRRTLPGISDVGITVEE